MEGNPEEVANAGGVGGGETGAGLEEEAEAGIGARFDLGEGGGGGLEERLAVALVADSGEEETELDVGGGAAVFGVGFEDFERGIESVGIVGGEGNEEKGFGIEGDSGAEIESERRAFFGGGSGGVETVFGAGSGMERAEEGGAAGAEEEVADVGGFGFGLAVAVGEGDGAGGDGGFAGIGGAGDFLDFVAVGVAGKEIHFRINFAGIAGKELVDFADVFAEAFPIGLLGEFEMAVDTAEEDREESDVVVFVGGDGGEKLAAFGEGDAEGDREDADFREIEGEEFLVGGEEFFEVVFVADGGGHEEPFAHEDDDARAVSERAGNREKREFFGEIGGEGVGVVQETFAQIGEEMAVAVAEVGDFAEAAGGAADVVLGVGDEGSGVAEFGSRVAERAEPADPVGTAGLECGVHGELGRREFGMKHGMLSEERASLGS